MTESTPPPPEGHSRKGRDVARVERLASLLDNAYLDPIIGLLLPGVGDAVTSVAGLYAVKVAISNRLPVAVIARMLINLAIDLLVGAVPILGDVFDIVFKANRRNAALLSARHPTGKATAADWAVMIAAIALLLLALGVPFLVAYGLIRLFS